MKKMQTLSVTGRRWFKKTGNTYHSVAIEIDGEFVHKVPYAYGYDQHYLHTAAEWLEKNGYMPGREVSANSYREELWRYCERLKIHFTYSATDVSKKKDL